MVWQNAFAKHEHTGNFSDNNFRQFMNGYQDPSFWLDLAFFLIACRKKRKAGLRALAAGDKWMLVLNGV